MQILPSLSTLTRIRTNIPTQATTAPSAYFNERDFDDSELCWMVVGVFYVDDVDDDDDDDHVQDCDGCYHKDDCHHTCCVPPV